MSNVKAWQETIKIPTYKTGEPDKNPMFLEKRVYQGSSGVVYPYPVIDKVYDEKEDKEWDAVFLENDYLKIMILPELGGRIQMAQDKTNGYDFIYHNKVIKPALVGLAGPWISGGIEFNWPQHHRPSTYSPTDFSIVENADGSKTVWVNEYEIMFRTKCALGFTLYPDRAYIELHAKIFNRTPFPQTFLWWANPAVAADEHYQSIFPPDVNAVYDHGKRDVSSFPIATGTYYKVDYSPGTDISRYHNIPVPTSYMAVNSAFNFVGGYHHQKKAGMLHIADHNVSPGKKQWTWGYGEFGRAWDRQLTDNDGPYLELMCGVFTDNQPDFSWIMPNEVREFRQYFMPYKEIGNVKNASTEAVLNFEIMGNVASLSVYVTQPRNVRITLTRDAELLLTTNENLSPDKIFHKNINLPGGFSPQEYCVKVFGENDELLISYSPVKVSGETIPEPAQPFLQPSTIENNEELFLAGLHLEQYRHATYNPADYYKEALRRDDSDLRCNNAMGLLHLRRGEYTASETYLNKAVQKLTRFNPNPYDSEPLYNLGLCLSFLKKDQEALTAFYKSTWNAALQDSAFLQIAFLQGRAQNWNEALLMIEKSIARNYYSPKARHLKAAILRKLNKNSAAKIFAETSIAYDQFDFGSRYELYKINSASGLESEAADALKVLQTLMRGNPNSYIEIAIDYANAGMFTEAFDLVSLIADDAKSALLYYYAGFYASASGAEKSTVETYFKKGFDCDSDRVFPNRLEDVEVLQKAIEVDSSDYKALYYLGNFYYAKRRYEPAKTCWEKSINIFDKFPTTHRNLGIAYYNKFDRKDDAMVAFEKAFDCDQTDSRVLFELDQLKKRFNYDPRERLLFLSKYHNLVSERDDLYIEFVALHFLLNKFEEAGSLLASRNFHPWEGGEGKTSGQHISLKVELAKKAYQQGIYAQALSFLEKARNYPENLGEGKLSGARENDIDYWTGCVYSKMGETDLATRFWKNAAAGDDEPTQAIFYNDQQPDKIFYQGLALKQLSDKSEAERKFRKLIRYGKENVDKEIKIDFFAVSLPDLSIFDDDLNIRNRVSCLYLMGLGHMGLNHNAEAKKYFKTALELDHCHAGCRTHLEDVSVMERKFVV